HKRKSDPAAPTTLAVALGLVYLVTTVGLTVVLEVVPELRLVAPALFPALAVVGAVNLALISQQEQREAQVAAARAERQVSRAPSQTRVQPDVQKPSSGTPASGGVQQPVVARRPLDLEAANRSRQDRRAVLLDAMVDIYRDSPDASPTVIARQLGIGRSTAYSYLADLLAGGHISRNNGRVTVRPKE
ncbi:MAG: hypothetical protein KJ734_10690, partial [Chloroflexi bacterium]|nr:hypothetical protein [Chloroflexota bacterium]